MATTVTGSFQVTGEGPGLRYVNRYVGFTRSRISDRGMVEFDEFNESSSRSLQYPWAIPLPSPCACSIVTRRSSTARRMLPQ